MPTTALETTVLGLGEGIFCRLIYLRRSIASFFSVDLEWLSHMEGGAARATFNSSFEDHESLWEERRPAERSAPPERR